MSTGTRRDAEPTRDLPLTDEATPRRQRRRTLDIRDLAGLLLVGDMVAVGAAAVLAPPVWDLWDPSFAPREDLRLMQVASVAMWSVLLLLLGRGDVASPRFLWRSLSTIGQAALGAAGIVLLLFFLAPFFAPRGATFISIPLTALMVLGWRMLFVRIVRAPHLRRRVAFVGSDEAVTRAATAMHEAADGASYELIAVFTPERDLGPPIPGIQVLPATRNFWGKVQELDIDLLVVGHTRRLEPEVLGEISLCFEHQVETVPATRIYEHLAGRVMASALEADWYADLPTHARGLYPFVKRAIDLTVGAILVVALLPVMALVGLAVFLDSGSPVIYRQIRSGLGGQPFVLHKFRSMRRNAEPEGAVWAMEFDPRVTRVGRWLRTNRLDELPQLWDVVRGRMSLIGPRPERPEFVTQLVAERALYRARSVVRPGITGWAQVQYRYASTMAENLTKLEYDLYYIRNLSLALDLSIAFRTLAIVLSRRGR